MIAQHFLWAYPKNYSILAETFKGVGMKQVQGQALWGMIEKISALVLSKVQWDPSFDQLDTEIFIISVDGKDFRIWEPKHPLRRYDKDYSSHKYSGKKAVCDGTYKGSKSLAKPDCLESKELKNFKSRARNRQETINGRLTFYACLNHTFTHGIPNHKHAFQAVLVMVQTQMEHGAELFAI